VSYIGKTVQIKSTPTDLTGFIDSEGEMVCKYVLIEDKIIMYGLMTNFIVHFKFAYMY